MKTKDSNLKPAVFLFPLFFISALFIFKSVNVDTYRCLVAEDGIFEQLQAGFYFMASIVFLFISMRFLKTGTRTYAMLFLFISLVLALVCAEEISWGQRILGLESPGWFARNNVQQELSIHNLSLFQPFLHLGYILTGLAGAAGWLLVRASNRGHWRGAVPGWYLSSYFLPVSLIYFYFEISFHLGARISRAGWPAPNSFLDWRDQELAELLLSLGFFLFACISCAPCRLKSRIGTETSAG